MCCVANEEAQDLEKRMKKKSEASASTEMQVVVRGAADKTIKEVDTEHIKKVNFSKLYLLFFNHYYHYTSFLLSDYIHL